MSGPLNATGKLPWSSERKDSQREYHRLLAMQQAVSLSSLIRVHARYLCNLGYAPDYLQRPVMISLSSRLRTHLLACTSTSLYIRINRKMYMQKATDILSENPAVAALEDLPYTR